MAVWFVFLLLETAFAQWLQAEVAHKVVGVKLGPHGGDAAAQNGLLAGLAHAATGLVVVRLAQRLPLVFEEAAVHEGAVAFLEREEQNDLFYWENSSNVHRSVSYMLLETIWQLKSQENRPFLMQSH